MFSNGLKIRLLCISGLLLIYGLRLNSVAKRWQKIPNQSQIKLVSRISSQPYLKDSNQFITLDRFLVVTDRFPGYSYGQKIEVVGRLQKKVINRFKTNLNLNYPSIRLIEEEESLINQTKIVGFLLSLRSRIEESFSRFLPEPQASLLAGILLGSKRQLPQNFLKNLQETGTIHIVVASGYNISVIAGFLLNNLVVRIGRKKALLISFVGILIYSLMAGAQPPIVRAAIMGSLTYLAQLSGREKDGLRSLVLAAAIMLLVSPLILFDIGFQLSFTATAGILLLSPILKGKTTLAAQIATLPILLANFGQVSWLSPLINALVLPTVPLIMSLGVLTVVAGQILAWLAWVPLTYFVKIIELSARLPWISFSVNKISFLWAVGYYVILGIIVFKIKKFKID